MLRNHGLKRTLFGYGASLHISLILSCIISLVSTFLYQEESSLCNFLIVSLWLGGSFLGWFLPKGTSENQLGLLWVLLGGLLATFLAVHFKVPFENDFYRYFFEGKAFALGHNPYLSSPEELAHKVPFDYFFSIGHPDLTGIYPPLTLFLFSLIGRFPFVWALSIFSLINGFLVWVVINKILDIVSPGLKRVAGPVMTIYLMREMVFQHHFELWPVVFFFLGLLSFDRRLSLFYLFVSFHLKFIALIPLGLLSLRELLIKRNLLSFAGYALMIGTSMAFLNSLGFFDSRGLKAFSESWYFSPGLLGWLYPFLKSFLSFHLIKIGAVLLGIFYLILVFMRRREEVLQNSMMFISLSMLTFFYISPVFNAWYALWPALLLMRMGKTLLGILCLSLSPLCYSYFIVGGESWFSLTTIHFIVHTPILISLWEELHLGSNHRKANQSASLS